MDLSFSKRDILACILAILTGGLVGVTFAVLAFPLYILFAVFPALLVVPALLSFLFVYAICCLGERKYLLAGFLHNICIAIAFFWVISSYSSGNSGTNTGPSPIQTLATFLGIAVLLAVPPCFFAWWSRRRAAHKASLLAQSNLPPDDPSLSPPVQP